MSMNDPLGDLLTRIRNAQMRNKSKVSSPGSKLRESVLEVLKSEGYIRGYTVTEREGRAELDIELKYFEGEPVIRENRTGFQARTPRLYLGEESAAHQQRSRCGDRLDAERRHGGSRRARRQCRRRNPLHGVLSGSAARKRRETEQSHVPHR
jgi:ribosomal protein S8